MHNSIEEFGRAANAALKAKPGAAGRSDVCAMLRELLTNKALMDKTFDDSTPERKLIYEDPELGFCVLAHSYKGAKGSPPHDHGPSWAIYGQVAGETKMSEWNLVTPAGPDKTGTVTLKKTYSMTPGSAYLYNEGDLHSPSRDGPTQLIRIEGTNMEKVKRFKYQAA